MTLPKRSLRSEQPAGSPSIGEPAFIVIGKLRRPHGVRGEILMDVQTDFPERLREGMTVYVGDQYQPLRVRSLRWHTNAILLSFHTYYDRDKVGELRNQEVYVSGRNLPPLPDGDYYHHQIIGLRVIDEDSKPLGFVTDILVTGANDVLIVQTENGRELLIPVINEVILDIDLDSHELQIHPIPGLI